jgi:hypothetical protein
LFGKAADFNEGTVGVGDLSLQIGLGHDRALRVQE